MFFSLLCSLGLRSELTIQCKTHIEVIPFLYSSFEIFFFFFNSIKIYIVNQLLRAKTLTEVSEGLVVENVSRCEQVLPM